MESISTDQALARISSQYAANPSRRRPSFTEIDHGFTDQIVTPRYSISEAKRCFTANCFDQAASMPYLRPGRMDKVVARLFAFSSTETLCFSDISSYLDGKRYAPSTSAVFLGYTTDLKGQVHPAVTEVICLEQIATSRRGRHPLGLMVTWDGRLVPKKQVGALVIPGTRLTFHRNDEFSQLRLKSMAVLATKLQ